MLRLTQSSFDSVDILWWISTRNIRKFRSSTLSNVRPPGAWKIFEKSRRPWNARKSSSYREPSINIEAESNQDAQSDMHIHSCTLYLRTLDALSALSDVNGWYILPTLPRPPDFPFLRIRISDRYRCSLVCVFSWQAAIFMYYASPMEMPLTHYQLPEILLSFVIHTHTYTHSCEWQISFSKKILLRSRRINSVRHVDRRTGNPGLLVRHSAVFKVFFMFYVSF